MKKYFVIFVFILCFAQSHTLYATEPDIPEPIAVIEAEKIETSEEEGN